MALPTQAITRKQVEAYDLGLRDGREAAFKELIFKLSRDNGRLLAQLERRDEPYTAR